MVTVFAGGVAQVEFGVVVLSEEFLHAIGVVVVCMAQNAGINLRNVDSHESGVLGELCGGSCVEQNALAVEFGVDAKAPFTFQLLLRSFGCARIASGTAVGKTADVVYENFDFHFSFFGGRGIPGQAGNDNAPGMTRTLD